jgi:hypothetical protein
MSRPFLTIAKHERTAGCSLSGRPLAIIADVLSGLGYVLLPSDTT